MIIDYKEQFKTYDEEVFRAVKDLKSSDSSDLNILYDLTKNYFYKLISDIVRDPFTADEVLEETYKKINADLSSLSTPERFYAWAGRIATRFSLEAVQKNRYLILDEESSESDFVVDIAGQDNEEFIPEAIFADAEKQRILADKIDALSVEQRICIQFFYYEEMSVKEIADAFGCDEIEIRNLLGSVRKELKDTVVSMNIPTTEKLYSLAAVPVFYILFRIGLGDMIAVGAAGASASGAIGGSAVSGSTTGGAASAGSASATSVSGVAVMTTKISSDAIIAITGIGVGLAVTAISLVIGNVVSNVADDTEVISEDIELAEESVAELEVSEEKTYDLTPEEYEAFVKLFSDVENIYSTYSFFGNTLSETNYSDAAEWVSLNCSQFEDEFWANYDYDDGIYEGYYINNGTHRGIIKVSFSENRYDENGLGPTSNISWLCEELSLEDDGYELELLIAAEAISSKEEEWYPFMRFANMNDYLSGVADINWNEVFQKNGNSIDFDDGRKVVLYLEDRRDDLIIYFDDELMKITLSIDKYPDYNTYWIAVYK